MATLAASVIMSKARRRSAAIVELLDEPFELLDVVLGELLLLTEVRDPRRHAPTEHTVEEAVALAGQPGVTREHGGVHVPPVVLLRAQRALVQQAIEERLDGGLAPVRDLLERRD